MKLHEQINNSYQLLLEQIYNVGTVLLHPDSRYRSALVARLVNTPDLTAFYYAMGPDDIDLASFISSLVHDLSDQHPTFGRHISLLYQDVYEDLDTNLNLILETFANELEEMSEQPFLFILDEYDRSDSADDVQRFIEKLVDYLPNRCHIVINSRTLPRLSWASLIAKRKALLLKDEHLIRRNFYNTMTGDKSQLEVYALGPGYVLIDGKLISEWEGHLPRLLLFFALDRPVVTRSEICQAFWSELTSDQAVNVFHVTKRRLHKALGMDVLIHEGGYYRLNPELTIYYDAMEFAETLMEGRDEDNSDREAAWDHACNIYRGEFLQGHNDRWISERRNDFLVGYLEAMTNRAQVWLNNENTKQALTICLKALSTGTHHEALHRAAMELYNTLGRRSEAIAHYQQLIVNLEKNKQKPELETQELYENILID